MTEIEPGLCVPAADMPAARHGTSRIVLRRSSAVAHVVALVLLAAPASHRKAGPGSRSANR